MTSTAKEGKPRPMKRFALPSIVGGFAVAFFATMVRAGLSGANSREDWFTGCKGTFSLALVSVFLVLWIAATFVIDCRLARYSDAED